MRIGILGGTFDPVHMGHVALAQAATSALALDRLIWMPAFASPLTGKDNAATRPALRLQMVEETIRGNSRYEVSALEIERRNVSYTVDTLRELRRRHPNSDELFWLVGGDWASSLSRWKDLDVVLTLCRLVLAKRPGFDFRQLPRGVQLLDFNPVDISSSRIRDMIQQGESVERWVPAPALRVIREHHLYQHP